MRRGFLIAGVVALAAIVAVFVYMRLAMTPPAELDVSRSRATAGGLYNVAISPESEPIQQNALHGWTVTVTTRDGQPVSDAQISVDGGMPQHGHGLPTSPQITDNLGDGRYRLEGVRFNMSGWWVLRFSVTAPAGTDTVEFNLTL